MRRILPVFLVIVSLTFSQPVLAGTIYLDPSSATVGQGGSLTLTVRLDTTAEECINAVDWVMQFDEGLSVVDVSVGNSIFNFWVEPPTFDNETHTITFAGGIPNGYCGRVVGDPQLTNALAEIVIRADTDINASVWPAERAVRFTDATKGYLNDGLGTAVKLDRSDAQILITDSYTPEGDESWLQRIAEDTQPPKQFSITLTQSDSVYNGKYFIVFNTNDKQTGIDHYEVIEEPLDQIDLFGWGAATAPWVRATSPYLLQNQSLNSTIRVKAVDKAGNEYIATLVPDESLRGFNYNTAILYGLSLFFFAVVVISIWFAWHAWHTRRRIIEDEPEYVYESEE